MSRRMQRLPRAHAHMPEPRGRSTYEPTAGYIPVSGAAKLGQRVVRDQCRRKALALTIHCQHETQNPEARAETRGLARARYGEG